MGESQVGFFDHLQNRPQVLLHRMRPGLLKRPNEVGRAQVAVDLFAELQGQVSSIDFDDQRIAEYLTINDAYIGKPRVIGQALDLSQIVLTCKISFDWKRPRAFGLCSLIGQTSRRLSSGR